MDTLSNFEKYVQDHMVETRGHCALQSFGVCTCDDGTAARAIEEAFAPAIEKYKPAQLAEANLPEPLPVEVVDKFAPYESLYELTLTIDTDDVYTLRQWFGKIVKSHMYEVKGYIACIELQANGNPHIHALLFSRNKYCDGTKVKKGLKFPWRYTMKRVRMPANYYQYINKEKDTPALIDYCAAKGVDQIWEELFN